MLVFLEIAVVFAAVLTTAFVVYWRTDRQTEHGQNAPNSGPDPLTLLFDDGILHHATQSAAALLSVSPGTHFWDDVRTSLLARFPDFPEFPKNGTAGHLSLRALDDHGPQEAMLRWRGSLCWVTLSQDSSQPEQSMMQPMVPELDALRRSCKSTPNPAWEEDAQGHVCWHNTAYANLFLKAHGEAVRNDKPLFSKDDTAKPGRAFVHNNEAGSRDWFEVTSVSTGQIVVFHATSISAVVAAEETQRNFVQTLAKTFAHLSIGLAIFDRNKQLALFNPALVDLTALPAQFLSARPDMLSFFDQLREKRKMPEPKNYLNWREEIADVIAAAADGRYQETWSLETGQTYSVQGRPHPDGATAFLIEDITAEMTLTRNFRAELEQAQIVLDTVDDAIAIFSPAGVLTFSNAAYKALWQVDPDTTFADMTLQDSVTLWKERALSGDDVLAIGRFSFEFGQQTSQEMTLHLRDKTVLQGQMSPIPSGATLIRFRPMDETVLVHRKHPLETV